MEKQSIEDYYDEIGGLDAVQALFFSTHPEMVKERKYLLGRNKLRLIRLYLMNYQNTEKWGSMPDGVKEPLDELIDYLTKLLNK